MRRYDHVAVINTNLGSISDILGIDSGIFTVGGDTTVNATNEGWDSVSVEWDKVISKSKTAYAAGTYRKAKLDFNGIVPVVGFRYVVKLKQYKSDIVDEPLELYASAVAETGWDDLDLAKAFYDKFLEYSETGKFVITHEPVHAGDAEHFFVEGQFGTANLEIGSFGVEVVDDSVGTIAVTDTASFAQCTGHADFVDYYADGYAVAGKTYTRFEVKYWSPGEQNIVHGNKTLKEKTGLVLVNEDVLTVFLNKWNIIFSGLEESAAVTIASFTKANPGIVTKTTHGLVTGDIIILEAVSADNTGEIYDTQWLALNGVPRTVTKTGDDTFTLAIDTSAYTYAFLSGRYRKLNPYLKR